MSLAEPILRQFEQEAPVTRRVLERVPLEKGDWQPHPKSMALGRLASWLAGAPGWAAKNMHVESFDASAWEPLAVPATSAELLATFDAGASAALAELRKLDDTGASAPWSFRMGEKTLRWPGHAEAVKPLVADGSFTRTIRERCTADPPADLVVLLVRFAWNGRCERVTLVDRYDPATRLTAMSRTTALTTSVGAQLLAAGLKPAPGVQPLENVGRDERAFAFFRERLAARGVCLAWPPVPEI